MTELEDPSSPCPLPVDFDAGGLRLRYWDWGQPATDEGVGEDAAPTMLLLHGLQDCGRSWDAFAAAMRSDYRVIALDSRGHGDSEHSPSGAYGFRDYIADVDALARLLGLRDVALVGHSAGGRCAFAYAAARPEFARALIVVDIDPDAYNANSQGMFARYNVESDEWDSLDAVVERLRSRQPRSDGATLRRQALHMTRELPDGRRAWKRDRRLLAAYERPDLWDEWRRVSVPALILRGRQSGLLTHEVAVRMREANRNARLAELEGGGHWFYQESPWAFEAAARWFLDTAGKTMAV